MLQSDVTNFEQAANSALRRLQIGLGELVGSLPVRISKAADVHRALGVDAKLGWQVYRTMTAHTPAAAGATVPPRVSFEKLLSAARKKSVPADVIERALEAFRGFEEVVAEHAGDRETFESMLAPTGTDERDALDLRHKKAAFRANVHLRGAQARTQLKSAMLFPSLTPERYHLAIVRGFVDLQRSNPSVPLVLGQHGQRWAGGPVEERIQREPLDAGGEVGGGVSLLREFSSSPAPRLQAIRHPSGSLEMQLVDVGVGRTSAMTLLTGEVIRDDISPYAADDDSPAHETPTPVITSHTTVSCACETLVHDMLLYDEVFDLSRRLGGRRLEPKVFVYDTADPGFEPPEPPRIGEPHVLPVLERASYIGAGPDAVETPDVPGYAAMVRLACRKMGVDPMRMRVYRCRIEYPVIPSTVALRLELPPPG